VRTDAKADSKLVVEAEVFGEHRAVRRAKEPFPQLALPSFLHQGLELVLGGRPWWCNHLVIV